MHYHVLLHPETKGNKIKIININPRISLPLVKCHVKVELNVFSVYNFI